MRSLRITAYSIIASLFITSCSEKPAPESGVENEEPAASETFVKGADLSWVTEMENDGMKFYDYAGEEKDCFALMKEIGMNAIRLRVWVNPENDYGRWSDKQDVVNKARRADEAGLDIMIDFHYSDFFADPGKQTKPAAWADKTFAELKQAVSDHTSDVLNALKSAGIFPEWIQIGNETRNGMLWSDGQLWTSSGKIEGGWKNYAALSNAGYDAAKSIFPDATILVHQNNAWEDLEWWFRDFLNAGGKFDMIGLSHYPQSESDKTWQNVNSLAISHISSLGKTFGRKVMIVETGVKTYMNESTAAQVLKEFMTEAAKSEHFAGVFYWEPQTNGSWKPEYYKTLSWNAYDMGAFTKEGKPSSVLESFNN